MEKGEVSEPKNKTEMKEKLTPKTAKTFNQICKLKRDNVSTGRSWIMIAGDGFVNHITIQNQKRGFSSTGRVVLTKKEFERFIKFYETGV